MEIQFIQKTLFRHIFSNIDSISEFVLLKACKQILFCMGNVKVQQAHPWIKHEYFPRFSNESYLCILWQSNQQYVHGDTSQMLLLNTIGPQVILTLNHLQKWQRTYCVKNIEDELLIQRNGDEFKKVKNWKLFLECFLQRKQTFQDCQLERLAEQASRYEQVIYFASNVRFSWICLSYRQSRLVLARSLPQGFYRDEYFLPRQLSHLTAPHVCIFSED